jgi:uncharacterized protein (TIGR01244 family)
MLNDHPINVANLCTPNPDILACGMPNEQDLLDAAKKGIKTIINLCPAEETPPTEAGLVQQLSMAYINIPIRGPQDLTPVAAQKLAEVMDDCSHHPLLIHCRSANRVGALIALKEFWFEGKSQDEALSIGRTAGLTKLEAGVAAIMRQQPSA